MSEFAFSVNYNPAQDNTFTINHNLSTSGVRVTLENPKVFTATGAYKLYEIHLVDANNVQVVMFKDMFLAGQVTGKVIGFPV